MTEKLIWREQDPRMTPARIVADFAAKNWPEPREATPIDAQGRFRLVDGFRTYVVRADDRDGTINIYAIED